LTFLFSFVQIIKADSDFSDVGYSVWTTDPGFFGIGTWIPLFALLAAAAALARGFVKGLADKEVAGFGLLQVQLAAVAFAVLLWLGYMVNILLSDNVTFGLGAFLLFLGLAGVAAGTVLSVMDLKKGTTTGISTAPGGPPSGQWGPTPPPDPSGQWPQPAPGQQPQPAPGQGQWPQPPAPPPPDPGGQWPQPPPPAWDPNAPAAPGQWQPDPAGAPAPPQQAWSPSPGGPEQAWQPPTPGASDPFAPQPAPPGPVPEPGPLDPQPAPPIGPQPEPGPAPAGGGLFDPGTQVIPGPPPAPPSDQPGPGGGPDANPPIPPSNTP
jgi:hypothetical protein